MWFPLREDDISGSIPPRIEIRGILETVMKLHLGCGQRYLKGYVNIDYPPDFQSVQLNIKADLYQDITKLNYEKNSIDEIRLHHVFEHFMRPDALAQLCKWREWLKVGGLLKIETPDAMAGFKIMSSPLFSYPDKQQVLRHIFGSHEASWAIHCDGWYKNKFEDTLKELGFNKLKFKKNSRGLLRNIEVLAYKTGEAFNHEKYKKKVTKLLAFSTIKFKTKDRNVPEGSEAKMLKIWVKKWKKNLWSV